MGLFGKRRPRPDPSRGPTRLHIGCGQQAIPGWINIDNQGLPGVDQVLDVRRGLPFADVATIYAEHFLEHLSLEDVQGDGIARGASVGQVEIANLYFADPLSKIAGGRKPGRQVLHPLRIPDVQFRPRPSRLCHQT